VLVLNQGAWFIDGSPAELFKDTERAVAWGLKSNLMLIYCHMGLPMSESAQQGHWLH